MAHPSPDPAGRLRQWLFPALAMALVVLLSIGTAGWKISEYGKLGSVCRDALVNDARKRVQRASGSTVAVRLEDVRISTTSYNGPLKATVPATVDFALAAGPFERKASVMLKCQASFVNQWSVTSVSNA